MISFSGPRGEEEPAGLRLPAFGAESRVGGVQLGPASRAFVGLLCALLLFWPCRKIKPVTEGDPEGKSCTQDFSELLSRNLGGPSSPPAASREGQTRFVTHKVVGERGLICRCHQPNPPSGMQLRIRGFQDPFATPLAGQAGRERQWGTFPKG